MDNVAIVLHGYSLSKEQLNRTVEHYINSGFTKIVVSSYERCVDLEYMRENKVIVVLNDGDTSKDIDSNQYGNFKPNFGIKFDGYFPDDIKVEDPNTNFYILTSKRGVNKAYKEFKDVTFILRSRADLIFNNLPEICKSWIKELFKHKPYGKFLKHRLLAHKFPNVERVVGDFYTFGHKDDIFKQVNIPLKHNKERDVWYVAYAFFKSNWEGYFDWNYAFDYYYSLDKQEGHFLWLKEECAKLQKTHNYSLELIEDFVS